MEGCEKPYRFEEDLRWMEDSSMELVLMRSSKAIGVKRTCKEDSFGGRSAVSLDRSVLSIGSQGH